MKFNLLLLLSAIVLLSSCTDYGKKVEFGKSEVYYKGKDVTEKQAKALGDYLIENGYMTESKAQSVQMEHDGEDYIVRFAYDEKVVDDDIRFLFWKLQYNLSSDVFDGEPVRVSLADETLKDFEVLNPIAKHSIGNSLLLYDNAEIKKAEAKKLADFLQEVKLAGDNRALVFFQKQDEVPVVKVVVTKPDNLGEDELMVFSYYQELMRDQVFNGKSKAKLVLTSAQFEDLDPLPKLTAAQRQAFENQLNPTQDQQYQYTEKTVDPYTQSASPNMEQSSNEE